MTRTILGLMMLVLSLTSGCASAPPERLSPVGRMEREWSDPERTRWNGTGERPLHTTIWYPAARGTRETPSNLGPPGAPFFRFGWVALDAPIAATAERMPLILLSHGTGGSSLDLSWLAEELASRGTLVAAVTHHGNSIAADDLAPQGFYLWWERARDLTLVLDRLLLDPALNDRIDLDRVGAAGFSIGGHTVVLLGGARVDLDAFRAWCESADALASSCEPPPEALAMAGEAIDWESPTTVRSLAHSDDDYRDPRIRALYAIAPAVATAMTPASLGKLDVPLRVVVGDADTMAPREPNTNHLIAHTAGASLLELRDVDHYTFLPSCGWAGRWALGEVCAEREEPRRATVHRRVAEDAFAFFAAHLARPTNAANATAPTAAPMPRSR